MKKSAALRLGAMRVPELREQTAKLVLTVDRSAKASDVGLGQRQGPGLLVGERAGVLAKEDGASPL